MKTVEGIISGLYLENEKLKEENRSLMSSSMLFCGKKVSEMTREELEEVVRQHIVYNSQYNVSF